MAETGHERSAVPGMFADEVRNPGLRDMRASRERIRRRAGMTHRSTWKRGEARVARLFGARRTPLSGSNSAHTAADVIHPDVFVEVKYRARWSVLSLYDRVAEMAAREKKLPVLVLQEKRRRGAYAVIPLEEDHLRGVLDALRRPSASQNLPQGENDGRM